MKQDEPIETFFIDDNDLFDQDEISEYTVGDLLWTLLIELLLLLTQKGLSKIRRW